MGGIGKTEPDPAGTKELDGCKVPAGSGVKDSNRKTDLLYNEYIVYDVAQVQAKYLLQMSSTTRLNCDAYFAPIYYLNSIHKVLFFLPPSHSSSQLCSVCQYISGIDHHDLCVTGIVMDTYYSKWYCYR